MAALSRREEAALLVGTVTPAAGAVRTAGARGALAAVPMQAVEVEAEVEAEALVAAPTGEVEAPVAVQAAVVVAGAAIASSKNSLQWLLACDRVKSLIPT
jgi:hypothetical protein